MATKGYNSYHGKMSTGKKVLLIVLIVILLLAVAYLFCQRYVVYDSTGHITFSFLQKKEEPATPPETPVDDPIEITREDPVGPTLTALKAHEMSAYFAPTDWQSAVSALSADTAVVVDVKNTDGDVIYASATAHPNSVAVGSAADSAALQQLTATDRYTIARVACFWDLQYAYALPEETGICTPEGRIWYDGSAECWLDPGKEAARTYMISLCKEIAALGFDEILLDYCSYPTTGNFARLDYGLSDKTANLTAFVTALRDALGKEIVISVAVHDDVAANSANSGLSVAFLTESFDRIYVDTDAVTMDSLQAVLPADFDSATRLVAMSRSAAASGSYMLRAD